MAPNAPAAKTRTLWIALIAVALVAITLGGFAALFYFDLAQISPCDGGLAPGGPSCSGTTLQVEQLGQSRLVNGTYSASMILYPGSANVPLSNDLSISVWNDSGRNVPLLSVTLSATWGRTLANFSASGTNWTTAQSVEIPWPDVLTIASSTALAGQYISVADTAIGEWSNMAID
ncbi:MAG: hypothetical protein L3K02_04535 [Thermoplasmata archaeon]|nr:hypothetical protein [Thermoplasmata archaeon]